MGSGASKKPVNKSVSNNRIISLPHQHSNEHINLLVKGLSLLRHNSALCDVTICINETEKGPPLKFPSHKCVLAASSGYFRDKLGVSSRGFEQTSKTDVTMEDIETSAEPEMTSPKHVDVTLDFSISKESMEVVLQFLYTAIFDAKTNQLPAVLEAAVRLDIASLKRRCLNEIMRGFDTDSFQSLYKVSIDLDLSAFKDFLLSKIAADFVNFVDTDCFQQLTENELQDIVNNRNGTLSNYCIIPELQMFNAIIKWQKHNPRERIASAVKLLKTLHYAKIPQSTLSGYVITQSIVADNKELFGIVEDVLDADKKRILNRLKQKHSTHSGAGDVIMPTRTTVVVTGGRRFDQFTSTIRELNIKEDAWKEVGRMPSTLAYHQVAAVDNLLYVVGGLESSRPGVRGSAATWRFDPMKNEWETLQEMLQERAYFYLGALDQSLFAIGGKSHNLIRTSVEKYNITTKKWEFVASLKAPRFSHAGCVYKQCVYISGGVVRKSSTTDLLKYDVSTNHWAPLTPMRSLRSSHTMAAVRDRILVFGGECVNQGIYEAVSVALECYIPQEDQWHKVAQKISFQGEKECACAELDGLVYLIGGCGSNVIDHRNDVASYDAEKDEWKNVAKLPTRLRGSSCCLLML